jgi:hypothetical protein
LSFILGCTPGDPTKNPFGTVKAYCDDPVFSGFVSDENRDALAGTSLSLLAQRSGAGRILTLRANEFRKKKR